MADSKELAKMSKSDYGKYTPAKTNKTTEKLANIFLKTSPTKSYIEGGLTIGVIVYWLTTQNPIPLYIWVGYSFLMGLVGIIYWSHEKKRLSKEMVRLEDELQGIQQELKERQAYFEKLRKEIEEKNKN